MAECRLCRSSSSCQNPIFLNGCLNFSPHPCLKGVIWSCLLKASFKAEKYKAKSCFFILISWALQRQRFQWVKVVCNCSMTQLSGICQNLTDQGLFLFVCLFLRLYTETHCTHHWGWGDQRVVQNMEGTLLHTDAKSAHHSKVDILLVWIWWFPTLAKFLQQYVSGRRKTAWDVHLERVEKRKKKSEKRCLDMHKKSGGVLDQLHSCAVKFPAARP